MKVWTLAKSNGHVMGVYFDRKLALRSKRPSDVLEEWEPEITDDAAEVIKNLAEELR